MRLAQQKIIAKLVAHIAANINSGRWVPKANVAAE
jgi:hypothetical protein